MTVNIFDLLEPIFNDSTFRDTANEIANAITNLVIDTNNLFRREKNEIKKTTKKIL